MILMPSFWGLHSHISYIITNNNQLKDGNKGGGVVTNAPKRFNFCEHATFGKTLPSSGLARGCLLQVITLCSLGVDYRRYCQS